MKTLKMLMSLFAMLILFSLQATAIPDNAQPIRIPQEFPKVAQHYPSINFEIMSKKQTAEDWLKIAVKEIKAKATKLKVKDTGALIASISGSIQELSGGDAYKASVLYNYYGIFPDMGVGKGIKKGDGNVSKLLGFKRKAKPWTREIAAQRHRFAELMQIAFADQAIENVKGSLLKRVVFKT